MPRGFRMDQNRRSTAPSGRRAGAHPDQDDEPTSCCFHTPTTTHTFAQTPSYRRAGDSELQLLTDLSKPS